jgi:hypothetical protein
VVRNAFLAAFAVLVVSACGSESHDHGAEAERPQSHVVLTRPDGSTLSFDDLAITCSPRYYDGEIPDGPIVEVWSDALGAAPRFFLEVVVADVGAGTTFELGEDGGFTYDDPSGADVFIGEDRGEWSGQQDHAAGTIHVERAGCDPEPHLVADVEGRLGDETSNRTAEVTIRLDLRASRDNPQQRQDPEGSTLTVTAPDGESYGLAPAQVACEEGMLVASALAGTDPGGRQPALILAARPDVLLGRHDLPFLLSVPEGPLEHEAPVLQLVTGFGTARPSTSGSGSSGSVEVTVARCEPTPQIALSIDGRLVSGPDGASFAVSGRLDLDGG